MLCCLSLRVRLYSYWLVFGNQQFGVLQLDHHSLLELTDWLCSYPFGLQHCFTTYRLPTDGTCFRYQRVKPNPSLLSGLFRAAVYGKPAFRVVAYLTLNGR